MDTHTEIEISVIVPTFNRASVIDRSVDSVVSVLSKSDNSYEILVIDDGSSDNTTQIVKDISSKNPSVKLVSIKHLGIPAAVRNIGIKKARGEFIAFQDSDDEWTNFNIKKRLHVFEDASIVLSYANAEYSDSGSGVKKHFVPKGTELGAEPFYKLVSRFHSPIPTPTVIVKKKLFDEIGYFNESLKVSEDVEFWSRAALAGNFSYYDEICAIINRDGSNISSLTSEKGKLALLEHEDSQLEMFNSLLTLKNISENQKSLVKYRAFELKSEMDDIRKQLGIDSKYDDLEEPAKPKVLIKLEEEYSKTFSGKANSLLFYMTFGNNNLHSKVKNIIRKVTRPFRRYI